MSDLPTDLSTLEVALRNLSHDERAVQLVRSFAERLGKTKQRQQVLSHSPYYHIYQIRMG